MLAWLFASAFALCAIAFALVAAVRDTPVQRAHAAPSPATAPSNDNFNNPAFFSTPFTFPGEVFSVTLPESTAGATLEPGESSPCGTVGATVWFGFAPDRAATVTIDTSGSDFDTVLAAYKLATFVPSPPGAGSLTNMGCNDDAIGRQSSLTINVEPYVLYNLQIGGKNGVTGTLHLRVECQPACAPPNDALSATPYVSEYQLPFTDTRSTAAATLEAGEQRPCGNIGATLWYQFTAQQDLSIVADTAGSDFNTVLAVYTLQSLVPSPPGGLTLATCVDDAGSQQARVAFTARANTTYYFQAGGANGASGSLEFKLNCSPACPPPNDSFARTIYTVPAFADQRDTEGATTEQGEPHPCGGIGRTVWYGLYLDNNEGVTVDTATSDFDTVLAVYEGNPPQSGVPDTLDTLKLVSCNDNAGNAQSRVHFDGSAGRAYFIQAGGHSAAFGALRVNIDCDPSPCPPFNDQPFRFRLGLASLPYFITVDTTNATTDAGETTDCGNMGRTAWYGVHADSKTTLRVETDGSGFDTAVAIYRHRVQGDNLASLERVACAAGAAGARAIVDQLLASGEDYEVQVGGRGGAGGSLDVRLTCIPACPPANDNAGAADAVWAAPFTDSRMTGGATLEPGEPQPCGDIGATVWWRMQPTANARVNVSTTDSDFVTAIGVYQLQGTSPPGLLTNISCTPSANGLGLAATSFDAAAGVEYFLQIGGVAGATGNLTLHVDCGGVECLPALAQGGGGSNYVVADFLTPQSGTITGPDTGSGGYLPGARH